MIFFLAAFWCLETPPTAIINLETHGILSFDPAMATAPEGQIGILDSANMQLVILDGQGKLAARAGRKGAGPGEFRWLSFITWNETLDAFAVFDYGNHRVSIWNLQAKLLAEYQIHASVSKGYFTDDQHLLAGRNTRGLRKRTPSLFKTKLPRGKPEPLWRANLAKPLVFNAIGGRPSVFKWDPRLIFDVKNGVIAVNFNQTQTLHLLDRNGTPISKPLPVAMPRYQLTDEAIKSVMDTFPPGTEKPAIGKMHRPGYWPMISRIQIESENRIWVYGFPAREGGQRPYQVLNQAGVVHASGMVPRIPKFVHHGKLYMMNSDENDDSSPSLEVYSAGF